MNQNHPSSILECVEPFRRAYEAALSAYVGGNIARACIQRAYMIQALKAAGQTKEEIESWLGTLMDEIETEMYHLDEYLCSYFVAGEKFYFRCHANDADHAREQLQDAEPNAREIFCEINAQAKESES